MAAMPTATLKEPVFAVCTREQVEGSKSPRWGAGEAAVRPKGMQSLAEGPREGKERKREMKITGTAEAKGPNVTPLPVGREMLNQQSPVRCVQESPGTCLNEI